MYICFIVVFDVQPVTADVEDLLQGKDHAQVSVVVQVELASLLLHGVWLDISGRQPRMKPEVTGVTNLLNSKLLDLIFRKSLLHALTQKIEAVL